tara:strand:- start:2417 stop:3757 length:1341 start_codon:yes stop_codon:yes gene_type:complete
MTFIRSNWQILFILLIGALLRFYNLGLIPGPVFDEVFYPEFALNYLKGEAFFSVHPPLGSYILAFGIYIYDLLPWVGEIDFSAAKVESINPLSFRWIGAVSGVILIYVGYKLAMEMLDQKLFALLVALFLALDGSLLVDSRLGLINIYLSLFGFMAILFFVRGCKDFNVGSFIISSLLLGAVISVKWNGLGFWLTLILFSLLIFLLNRWQIHNDKYQYPKTISFLIYFFSPFFIYLVFWLPELIHNEYSLIDKHFQMLSYHFENADQKAHPYSSPWYTWPLMIRPIGYFFDSKTLIGEDGSIFELYSTMHLFPNPALSFLSFLAVIILTFKWIEAMARPLSTIQFSKETYSISLILLGYYANFLPWVVASRSTFIYHYQPAAVFSFFALAFLLYKLLNKNRLENSVFYYSVLALVITSAIYWLPFHLGIEITSESFNSRMWFDSWI